MKIFAERLKDLRTSLNISARELAKSINVSYVAIYMWERCERLPNIENLIALAKFFNVSTDYLCGLED